MKINKLLKKMGMVTIATTMMITSIIGNGVVIYAKDITGKTETFCIGDRQIENNPELVGHGVTSIGSNIWEGNPNKMTDGNINTHVTVSNKGNAVQVTYWDNTMTNMTNRKFDEIIINEVGNNVSSFQILIRDPFNTDRGVFSIYEGTTIGEEKRIKVEELTLPDGFNLQDGSIITDVVILHIKEFENPVQIAELTVNKGDKSKQLEETIEKAWQIGNSKRVSYKDHERLFDKIYEAKRLINLDDITNEEILRVDEELKMATNEFNNTSEIPASEMAVTGYIHPKRLIEDFIKTDSFYDGDIDKNLLEACDRIITIGFWNVTKEGNIVTKAGYEQWEQCLEQLDQMINEIPSSNRPERWVSISPGGNMVGVPNSIDQYVKNVVDFLLKYNLDGIDMDWEYPNSTQEWNWYNELVLKLNQELDKHDKKLSCAISDWNINFSEDAIEAIDYFNVMFYDMFDSDKHHASMENAGRLVDRFDQKRYPRYKLNLGLGWYGREKDKTYGAQWLDYDHTYYQLKENLKPETNNVQANIVGANGVPEEGKLMEFGINGVDMTKRKVEMVLDQKYGGVMIWHLTADIEKSNPLSLMNGIEKQTLEYDNRKDLPNLALNRKYTATTGQSTAKNLFDQVDFRSDKAWELNSRSGEVEIDFEKQVTFNEIILMERKDRVSAFRIEAFDGTTWNEIYQGTQIGAYKVCKFDPVTSNKVRVIIDEASNNVAFYELEIFMNE